MKLEGRLIGPWVEECRRAWLALESWRATKKLALDLCGVTFVDEPGIALLREICRSTGAELLTSSPLSKHFAEQATTCATDGKKGD